MQTGVGRALALSCRRAASRGARLALPALLVAITFPGCHSNPPPPPPPPPPTPTPLPQLRVEGSSFVPALQGGVICCDDPRTPDVDEGIRDGWTLATDTALDGLAAASLNVTHYRTGPYSAAQQTAAPLVSDSDRELSRNLAISVKEYGPGEEILPDLRRSVQAANARRIYVEVDLVDNWALANGWNFYGDDCSVTQGAPPEGYLGWIRAVVAVTWDLEVTYNLGNEGFRCRPSEAWERGLYAEAKAALAAHGVSRPVGSAILLPDTRVSFDYRSLGDVFFAPPHMEIPVILTEDDGGDHTPQEWATLVAQARQNGTYAMVWRGTMSDRDFERAIQAR
jgi:hypothetical protein